LYQHGHIICYADYKIICAELDKPIAEHPDVQRLIGQVVELQKNLEVWREACGNNEKRIEELQAENKSKDKLIKSLDSL